MKQGDVTTQDEAVLLPSSFQGSFSRVLTVASGTQAITGVGFKPSSIIFLAVRDNSDGASWGFSDANLNDSGFGDRGGFVAGTWAFSASAISFVDAGPVTYAGNVSSIDIDGFTINWVKTGATTGTFQIRYLAFK